MSHKPFGISGPGVGLDDEDQIDSSSKPQKKQNVFSNVGQAFDISGNFGGEAVAPKEHSKAGAADKSAIQVGGLNASVMKPKPNKNTMKTTMSSSTGTGA